MDKASIARIRFAHPRIRTRLRQHYEYVNSHILGKHVRLRLTSVYRDEDEQAGIYAQGRTKPGKKISNAPPGYSIHNYGLAFDIVLLIDKDKNGTFESVSWDMVKDTDGDGKKDWEEVINYFKSQGWKWGGDFKSFKDYPHLEMTFGYNATKLKKKLDAGNVTTELIGTKTYNWVVL